MRRRSFIIMAGAAGLAASAGYIAFQPPIADVQMTPPMALRALRQGDVALIDIRRPDEWADTGVPQGAVPIDMRRSDFIDRVLAIQQAAPGRPVALICARGVRSRRMAAKLAQAGITDVVDVPEGMLGSGAGPGWVARGLPVTFDFVGT